MFTSYKTRGVYLHGCCGLRQSVSEKDQHDRRKTTIQRHGETTPRSQCPAIDWVSAAASQQLERTKPLPASERESQRRRSTPRRQAWRTILRPPGRQETNAPDRFDHCPARHPGTALANSVGCSACC